MARENLFFTSSIVSWYSWKSSCLFLIVSSRTAFRALFSSSWSPSLQGNKRKNFPVSWGASKQIRTVASVLGKKRWNPGSVVILWQPWERAGWALVPPLPEAGKSNPSTEKGRTHLVISSSTWDSRGSLDRAAESSFLSLTCKGSPDRPGDSITEWSLVKQRISFGSTLSQYQEIGNKYLIS